MLPATGVPVIISDKFPGTTGDGVILSDTTAIELGFMNLPAKPRRGIAGCFGRVTSGGKGGPGMEANLREEVGDIMTLSVVLIGASRRGAREGRLVPGYQVMRRHT